MNVSELSDEELNRAMIWLDHKGGTIVKYSSGNPVFKTYDMGEEKLRVRGYLTDWSLTGPLMVDNEICLMWEPESKKWDATEICDIEEYEYEPAQINWGEASSNTNPLRAICECYLMINHVQGK